MKYSKAQLAKHLDVAAEDVMETADRDNGEVVVILKDFRKFVIPPAALNGGKAASEQKAAVGNVQTTDGPNMKKVN